MDAIKQKLGVAFRLGMADEKFTGGIGFNIFKALQIDGAYAYDNYVECLLLLCTDKTWLVKTTK